MTVSEALKKHKEDCQRCRDKACKLNHKCLQQKDIEVYEKLMKYEAIGTVEELKALKEYKAKMEMQYLDDINNPLEPLKLSSALQSEIRKYNYRKEHKPQDISPLDYTIMYALKHCLEEQMAES